MNVPITLFVVAITLGALLYALGRRRPGAKGETRPDFSDEQYARYYDAKKAALDLILGPMHPDVGHAVIGFAIGGVVDMHYFPSAIPGTGFATMELIEPDGRGPRPNRIGTYELVAFTKLKMPPSAAPAAPDAPFNQIERHLCGIFTTVGRFGHEAVLNPADTIEVPGEEGGPYKCLILQEYRPSGRSLEINGRKHCLLLCVEVFRSEMEYARNSGSASLVTKLQDGGSYRYSDLDREPVVGL